MNKRSLHHIWTNLRRVNHWLFLAIFVALALTSVFSLRQNNLNAIKLRDQVLKVDEQNGDTEAELKKLREYIYSHMNTGLAGDSAIYPPIQLKYTYERLLAAENARVNASGTNLYNDAQAYCEKNFPQSFLGAGRLPCIQNYLDSHSSNKAQANPIPDSLYKFDFASPTWSPDLAGWSIVLAGLFLFLFIVRFAAELWLKRQLKNHL